MNLLKVSLVASITIPMSIQAAEFQGSETLRAVFEQAATEAGVSDDAIYAGGGSSTGEKAIVAGSQALAPMSRKIKDSALEAAEANGYEVTETVLALDAVSIFVKLNNRVRKLSIGDLKSIYSCEKTSWSDFGGSGSISVYARDENSGTTETFLKLVGLDSFGSCATILETGAEIGSAVSSKTESIGFSGNDAKTSNNKALAISVKSGSIAYEPTLDLIRSFDYPLTRELYMYHLSSGYSMSDTEKKLVETLTDRSIMDPIVESVGFVSVD